MRAIVLLAAAAALVTVAYAQTDPEHAAHHPEGASAPAPAAKKAPAQAKGPSSKAKTAMPAASGMPLGMDADHMKEMHKEMHKPGGMHDQMHGKDGKMMGGGQMSAMPPASAASK